MSAPHEMDCGCGCGKTLGACHADRLIPGPDSGSCPDCLTWVKAGIPHDCVPHLKSQRDGWMLTAQTSEREVAWLRKALGITSTEESCAIRDAMERVQDKDQNPHLADMSKLTVVATRGAIWLEETWREQAKMWERRCNQATRELSDAEIQHLRVPEPVLDALEEWLDHGRPDGVEVDSATVDRNVRWSVVRQWFEAAKGGGCVGGAGFARRNPRRVRGL